MPAPNKTPARLEIRLVENGSTLPPSVSHLLPQRAVARTAAPRNQVIHSAAPAPSATTLSAPAIPANNDARAMIEQGKLLLNQAARQQMLDPMFAQPAAKAPPLHPLARAMAASVVGEQQLTDRIYQYTLADGRRFCVTTPPNIDFAHRDGPAPATMAVATNCPR